MRRRDAEFVGCPSRDRRYSRRVRRLLVLAVASLALVACGSPPAPQTPPSAKPATIELRLKGRNIAPFTLTISPDGKITELGTLHLSRHTVASATEATLSSAVQSDFPGLS